MLNCKDATRLVSESMDHRLPTRQRLALRFHLMMCRYCSRFERQLRIVRAAARRRVERPDGTSTPVVPAGPTLSPEARERLRDAVREASDE